MSKIALATGAIYANNPAAYNDEQAWDKVLSEQFGSLAPDMKIFATHSRHMENSWAKVGAPDAIEFATTANNLLYDLSKNIPVDFIPLELQIRRIELAADRLLYRLPQKYLDECKPQLLQLKRTAQADKIALDSLKAGKLDPQLKILREEITVHEKEAVISEEAARKFIDDVIKFFDERERRPKKIRASFFNPRKFLPSAKNIWHSWCEFVRLAACNQILSRRLRNVPRNARS